MMTTTTDLSDLSAALDWCHARDDPFNAFNDAVLLRGEYTSAQRQITQALCDPTVSTIVVPAGHSVGKSYLAAGVILGWLTLIPDSGVMSTGPANTQLSTVLWGEIAKSRQNSPYLRNLGHLTKLPNQLKYDHQWKALGFSTDKDESLQGFHPVGPLLNVIDEASGVEDPSTWATLKSLKPRKTLAISNPLRPEGPFYELCLRAADDPSVRLIRIPSTSSPDIRIEHSTRGLADMYWLRDMAREYGVGSPIWQCRVAANFPEQSHNQLVPASWFSRCLDAPATRAGLPRMAIDLAVGNGGDRAVIFVLDQNGILDHWTSSTTGLAGTATKARDMAQRWGVPGDRVTYDRGGAGEDFANRLDQAGLIGSYGYIGGSGGGSRATTLRTASAWCLRERLDPGRAVDGRPQAKFRIPRELAATMRPEIQGLRYALANERKIALEAKETLAKRIKRSPDLADALIMAFALPW